MQETRVVITLTLVLVFASCAPAGPGGRSVDESAGGAGEPAGQGGPAGSRKDAGSAPDVAVVGETGPGKAADAGTAPPDATASTPEVGATRPGADAVESSPSDAREATRDASVDLVAVLPADGGAVGTNVCKAPNPWDQGINGGPSPTGKGCSDFCYQWFNGGKGGQGCWTGTVTKAKYPSDGPDGKEGGLRLCHQDCASLSQAQLCCRMAYLLYVTLGKGDQDIYCKGGAAGKTVGKTSYPNSPCD